MKARKAGAGVRGNNTKAETDYKVDFGVVDAPLVHQCHSIPPGHSSRFEIPRCGQQIFSSRKAAVFIATRAIDACGEGYL